LKQLPLTAQACFYRQVDIAEEILIHGRHNNTWARGGEGALAPSCHAPQGHDQTREVFQFVQFIFPRPAASQVEPVPTCDNLQLRTFVPTSAGRILEEKRGYENGTSDQMQV